MKNSDVMSPVVDLKTPHVTLQKEDQQKEAEKNIANFVMENLTSYFTAQTQKEEKPTVIYKDLSVKKSSGKKARRKSKRRSTSLFSK